MAVSEKGVAAAKAFGQDSKAFSNERLGEGKIAELEKQLQFIEQGLESAETTQEIEKLNKRKNKVMEQLGMTKIGDTIKPKLGKNKDGGKPKLKEGDKTDFGMLSVKAGIDNNPKPTQADRIAGATKNEKKTVKAKGGSRTGVRGTGAAKKGFRKARLS